MPILDQNLFDSKSEWRSSGNLNLLNILIVANDAQIMPTEFRFWVDQYKPTDWSTCTKEFLNGKDRLSDRESLLRPILESSSYTHERSVDSTKSVDRWFQTAFNRINEIATGAQQLNWETLEATHEQENWIKKFN